MENIKKKLANSKLTMGSWITLEHTGVAEIMAKSGFDWLAIDIEHSAISISGAERLIQVIELCGISPLVRVSGNDPVIIKRIMDAGAHGVIVPMINNREDALRAVNAVKYPPAGTRGVGLARAQGYGLEFEKYKNWVNNNSVVIVQIEHIDAVSNLEEILQVEGVDASIIGPYDLSASLGYPGDFGRKDVKCAVRKYLDACNKLGRSAGYHVIPPEANETRVKIREGFKFIGFSTDALFIGRKIETEMKKIRGVR